VSRRGAETSGVWRHLLIALGAAAAGALAWASIDSVAADLATERDLHRVSYVGSSECRRCHENHWESWQRTFHRTMTQQASEGTVLGDFGDADLHYLGVTARMHRGADGAFLITFDGPDERRTVIVERAVGSHRYQQYLAREDDTWLRLPVAWQIDERRWFHMNGAFLTPDPEIPASATTVTRRDYDRHVVRWNDNCIFCHNVAPDPGLDPMSGRFDTEVAEMGIACEACHGPGAEHVLRNHNPVRRYALHLGAKSDPSIVNPGTLPPDRSADICGRCHGQRIADEIAGFLRHGDPFVPGDDLSLYTSPLWQDTPLDGREGVFASRFWADGTARLSAYEYQGLLQSPCAQRGPMTCGDCHSMHEGDPSGQIDPAARGDGGCIGCHAELGGAAALAEHSGHRPGGTGARCVACHMPRIVYGLVAVHRSHRIESPDPARAARMGRPDACTLCHVERGRGWAVEAAQRLFGDRTGPVASPSDEAGADAGGGALPEVRRALLAGDPIERAVAADALGRSTAAADPRTREARLGALFDVMENDSYPAVRRIAWRSARALAETSDAPFENYRPASSRARRGIAIRAILAALPGAVRRPDAAQAARLRALASETRIHIGE